MVWPQAFGKHTVAARVAERFGEGGVVVACDGDRPVTGRVRSIAGKCIFTTLEERSKTHYILFHCVPFSVLFVMLPLQEWRWEIEFHF